MTVMVLQIQPTRDELAQVEGIMNNGALIGRPGEFVVVFDERKFAPPFPRWLNAGEELNVPTLDGSQPCWNCAASQPAPATQEQRDRENLESRDRVIRGAR